MLCMMASQKVVHFAKQNVNTSAKLYLVLVFLVSLKRKNILVAKIHFCIQNVSATKHKKFINLV